MLGVAQVLVDGLAADSIVTGKDGLWNTAYGAGTSTAAPFRCEDLFPSFVGAALLGQGDFFFLAFREERAFEFREGTQDGSMTLAIGESSPMKTTFSLTKLHPARPHGSDHGREHVRRRGCGRAVHAVPHHDVPVAGELE
ncbi:hypothetical protein G205_13492 [Arthrobacter nitrophenolicus]|uniref:Uncharacterized protein n=1 Tax=Arthrobacter nitrophenolicus TaxID=683150 RepID=L8TSH5_9MICC|nr:hypothetical protein G205_13492 [Arthrobacter nitrophenolicus]